MKPTAADSPELHALAMMGELRQWYTPTDLARVLPFGRSKIYQLLDQGKIPSQYFGGKRLTSLSQLLGLLSTFKSSQ